MTPDRLAEFLGAKELCWVIDDFHKIAPEHKQRLSQCMKIFYDASTHYKYTKIIVIGAVGAAREVVEYDPEMRTRVCELGVPLMTNDELDLILENGSRLLNVCIPSDIRKEIVRYSAGLASVCHQLALNMCLGRDIEHRQTTTYLFTHEDFNNAVKRHISDSSDSLKSVFEKALYRAKAVQKIDNCRLILSALAKGPREGMLSGEILAEIRKSAPGYQQSSLSTYLKELQQEKRGEVLRYDTKSAKYFYALPIYQTFAVALMSSALKPELVQSLRLETVSPELRQQYLEEIQKVLEKLKPGTRPNE